VSLTAIAGAFAAVLGTFEAVLAAVEFALLVTAHRSDLGALSLWSTGESGGTEAAGLSAAIWPALLRCTVVSDALRLAALNAFPRLAVEAGGAFSAASTTAVTTAFTVCTLWQADTASKEVANESVGASTALAATAIGAAFLSFAAREAVTITVGIAGVTWRTFATIAVAAVGTALFAGTLWCTVQARIELIFAVAVENRLTWAGFRWFGSADFKNALPDHDVLLLCLGAGVLPAAIGTDFVILGTIPEAVEQSLAVPRYLAGARETGLVGSTESAESVAAIGTTGFAVTVGHANGYAGEVSVTLETSGALTARTATAIGPTLFAEAGGLALVNALASLAGHVRAAEAARAAATIAATLLLLAIGFTATATTTILTLANADVIPLDFAAEGVHFADTLFAFAPLAAGIVSGRAAVATFAAVYGTVVAGFPFPEVALPVATDGTNGYAEVVLTGEGGWAGTAEAPAPIITALFADACRHTDGNAFPSETLLIIGTGSTGTTATVGAAFDTGTVWFTDGLAFIIVTEVPVVTEAAVAIASIGSALLVGAVRHAILTGLEFFLAGTVHGSQHAGRIEVQSALPQDALNQVKELILSFWSPLIQALEEAFRTRICDALH